MSDGRYHRQAILPGIGEEGQEKLLLAHGVVVGCGALGCASADLLARAGVGRITCIDRDLVEWTNLQRQTLYTEADVGTPKAEAAQRRLTQVNSTIEIHAHCADLTPVNAQRLLGFASGRPPDVILDGTDNLETRYLLNDVAVKHGVPFVYGGAVSHQGMTLVVRAGYPCLRCVFPEPAAHAPTCDTAGVFGPAPVIVGARQCGEAIKILVGVDEAVQAGLVAFDLWTNRTRTISTGEPRADCPCCGQRDFAFLDGTSASMTTRLCGRNAVQVSPACDVPVDLQALALELAPHGEFSADESLLRGTLAAHSGDATYSLTVFHDGRVIVEGTSDLAVARSVYARYIGS